MPSPIQFDQVADIYDDYVGTNFDIPFFLNETEGYNGEILELMCGTGRVSIPLLEAGRKMVCADYSLGMLGVFEKKIRGKNYPVELIRMDVTELNLGREFGLILLPFHSLSEILSADLQAKAIGAISKHLSIDGTFICTLQNPAIRLKSADGATRVLDEFTAGNGNKMIISVMNLYNPETGLVSGFQSYEISDPEGEQIEKRYLEINFRPIAYSEFKKIAAASNLEIAAVYGDYFYSVFKEETSSFMIFKLKKKARLWTKPENYSSLK